LAPVNSTLRLTGLATVLLGLVFLAPPLEASSIPPDELKTRQLRAQQFESLGQWDKACDEYAAILRLDRRLADVRESYERCLRRYHLLFRHRDFSYRKEVLGLNYAQALRLCDLVLTHLMTSAVDRHRVQPARLIRYGLEELTFALAEPEFRQEHLPNARPDKVEAFRSELLKAMQEIGPVRSRRDVLERMRHVALAAQKSLGLSAVVTVLECACGACAAVDEYTLFLSPGQLREWVDACKGTYVGVGLKVRREDGKLVVSEVVLGSPAAEATVEAGGMRAPALQASSHIVTIGKRDTVELTVEEAAALLEGEPGTSVELIVSPPAGEPFLVTLKRRPMYVPSINFARLEVKDGVGYLPISCFQETTLQELDDALVALNKAGMRALVLDLRGNGGGVFEAAVEVAQRFLSSGVIVSRQLADGRMKTYPARNLDAWTMPLVVLVDANTASAAEIVAGALKDNRRARVVGQTTFGKGSGQVPIRLLVGPEGTLAGGVRLTVARFFSPLGQPYAGRGVQPHILANPAEDADGVNRGSDHPLEIARLEAHKILDR
jgi:carboxyl-terminal processing protease